MSRSTAHLNTAKNIISQYQADVPLSTFLRSFFAKDKKYGSKDRRNIAALCYAYYRVSHAFAGGIISDKILAGVFLTSSAASPLLEELRPDWNVAISQTSQQKMELLQLTPERLFPFNNELSAGIDQASFDLSFLVQPKLFIRLRPNRSQSIEKKLAASNLVFERLSENCLVFENGTKVEEVLELNQEYVVQDYISQQTIGLLTGVFPSTATINLWDCCAASGGKSIMLVDGLKHVQLTVSDVRDSILANLERRFKSAAIKNYHSFEADLTHPSVVQNRFANKPFDLVVCDAPCTGSGTWSRTPEQLAFFHLKQIEQYSQLQKNIVGNVVQAIKKGGYLLYITCSVFKKENEEVVQYLVENCGVKLIKKEVLKGYDKKADSMFAALLQVQ